MVVVMMMRTHLLSGVPAGQPEAFGKLGPCQNARFYRNGTFL
jgi:hypothetical protein